MRIKLKEVVKQANRLGRRNIIKDQEVLSLMRFYELIKELKKIIFDLFFLQYSNAIKVPKTFVSKNSSGLFQELGTNIFAAKWIKIFAFGNFFHVLSRLITSKSTLISLRGKPMNLY